MRKKPHNKILREEPKGYHLNTVPKSCSYLFRPMHYLLKKRLIHYQFIEFFNFT